MKQDAGDEFFRFGPRNEGAVVALQSQSPKVPLAEDVLDRLALDETRHPVTFTKDYYIGVFEWTTAQKGYVYGSLATPTDFMRAKSGIR